MKKKRTILVGVGALVIAAAAVVVYLTRDGTVPTYRLEKVDRGDITVDISATGTLSAVTTVQVGSQVSGTIAKLYADFNSTVRKGQLLAQLDSTFLQATVNEQRAALDRVRAQVNDAQRTYNRTSDLFAKSLVSEADLDVATTALEIAKASLKQAEASWERATVNLRYATIRAPISGVVISRNVDVGQTVAASLQAPTLFSIANDLKKMQVLASVDEADIGNVKVGQTVSFRVDTYPDAQFEGTVSQIRLAPVVTQNVVTYSVIIDVMNPELKLMPGMTATVSIVVVHKEDILRVPIQALRFTPPGDVEGRGGPRGERTRREGVTAPDQSSRKEKPDRQGDMPRPVPRARVWLLKDGNPKPVVIVRGVQNTRYAEVVESDLKEGDEVIVGMTGTQAAQPTQNPLMPRTPGGPGRRGGF